MLAALGVDALGVVAGSEVLESGVVIVPATAQASTSVSAQLNGGASTVINQVRIHSVSAASSATYWEGWASECGGTPGSSCKSWWVDLHVAFTASATQAWVNGFSSAWCTAGGTNITGCSYAGNGTNELAIAAYFSSGGYLIMYVYRSGTGGIGTVYALGTPTWGNHAVGCIGEGNSCYS